MSMFDHVDALTGDTALAPAPRAQPSPDTLRVVLVHPAAQAPRRATAGAAGYDLCAIEAGAVEAWSHAAVSTGVAVRMPDGCYGRIAPRSSVSARGVLVNAGVVDQDYTGALVVMLHNASAMRYEYAAGARIAQLVLERIATPPVAVVAALPPTARAGAGFGSTGV